MYQSHTKTRNFVFKMMNFAGRGRVRAPPHPKVDFLVAFFVAFLVAFFVDFFVDFFVAFLVALFWLMFRAIISTEFTIAKAAKKSKLGVSVS